MFSKPNISFRLWSFQICRVWLKSTQWKRSIWASNLSFSGISFVLHSLITMLFEGLSMLICLLLATNGACHPFGHSINYAGAPECEKWQNCFRYCLVEYELPRGCRHSSACCFEGVCLCIPRVCSWSPTQITYNKFVIKPMLNCLCESLKIFKNLCQYWRSLKKRQDIRHILKKA